MDDVFIEKLVNIIQLNIENSELKVTFIASEIGLSRSQLCRKVNALTGLSISQYIRNIRLKYAHELLTSKSGTVSEIAYKSGFSSPSYFSKCFSELFTIPPNELIK